MNLVTSNLSSASMTGGLVQEFEHSILPTVKPIHTFLLTIAQMLVRLYAIHIDFGLTYQFGLYDFSLTSHFGVVYSLFIMYCKMSTAKLHCKVTFLSKSKNSP